MSNKRPLMRIQRTKIRYRRSKTRWSKPHRGVLAENSRINTSPPSGTTGTGSTGTSSGTVAAKGGGHAGGTGGAGGH